MKIFFNYTTVFFLALGIVSCDDDENPAQVNEEETITTVKLSVLEAGAAEAATYTWTADNQPSIALNANSSYNFKIEFLDESDPNDVEDITEEVVEEKDEHFVFYETTVAGLSFANASDDTIDSENIGINLSTDWATTDPSQGIIKAFLIHEPTTKVGDARDDFGGETDIEVDFTITVQ